MHIMMKVMLTLLPARSMDWAISLFIELDKCLLILDLQGIFLYNRVCLHSMHSLIIPINNHQAFIDALVYCHGVQDNPMSYIAQLDTGAQRTLISQKVVDQ